MYLGLYAGIIAAGGIVLLPALYAAAAGYLSLPALFLVALLANVTSDTFWYLLGRFARGQMQNVTFALMRRRGTRSARALFRRNQLKAIFFSKFVFGTRLAVQLIAGAERVPFFYYILLTFVGSALWLSFLVVLVAAVRAGTSSATNIIFALQISFAIFVLLALGVQYLMHRYIKDYMEGFTRSK